MKIDPAKDFLEHCLTGMNPWKVKKYSIGDKRIDILYESKSLYDYFNLAIEHLVSESTLNADFQIFARDHKTLPQPFWDWANIDSQGNVLTSGEVSVNYEHWSGMLRLFDLSNQVGVFWVRDLTSIPIWHRSFPFRTLLTRFFEGTSVQPVHSSAVAHQGKGVLLAGQSGSGKSSTAIAGLTYGLDFLGDDFNLVDTETQIIYSLYGIAKLEKHQVEVFPRLQQLPRKGDDEKDQIEVARYFPGQVVTATRLKAVIIPRITGVTKSVLTPIPSKEAIQKVIHSTLELLPGNRMTHFHKIGKICRTLPCYQLALSSNYKEVVDSLRDFLEYE